MIIVNRRVNQAAVIGDTAASQQAEQWCRLLRAEGGATALIWLTH